MTDYPVTPMPRDGGWHAYTEYSRRLSALLHEEHARAEQQAVASRNGQAAVDQITHRLAAQRQHLHQLAATLRLPEPHVGGIAPGPIPDPTEALRRAAAAADAADSAAESAHRRAAQPPLLPGLTPLARNALVYTAAAMLGTFASLLMFAVSPDTDLGRIPWQLVPWSLCGLPALAFFAGYLTISLVGQPRIGGGGTRSTRAGGVICLSACRSCGSSSSPRPDAEPQTHLPPAAGRWTPRTLGRNIQWPPSETSRRAWPTASPRPTRP